jgi:dienelactone hydrolase
MSNNKMHIPLLMICSIAIGLNWWGCNKDYPTPPTTTVTIPTNNSQIFLDSIADTNGYTYIASPLGNGPFPSVLYNHGGLGGNIGGDLKGTVIALAEAGYFARAELRQPTTGITGHLQEVETALDDLISDSKCDNTKVGVIGFSRGALLTLQAGKSQAGKVKAIVSMAPAQANGQLDNTLADVSLFDDPILLLVTENDLIQANHVQLAQMTYDSLFNNGKNVTQIIYPYFDSNGDSLQNTPPDDGHELFWEVQDPYWTDLINFLNTNL